MEKSTNPILENKENLKEDLIQELNQSSKEEKLENIQDDKLMEKAQEILESNIELSYEEKLLMKINSLLTEKNSLVKMNLELLKAKEQALNEKDSLLKVNQKLEQENNDLKLEKIKLMEQLENRESKSEKEIAKLNSQVSNLNKKIESLNIDNNKLVEEGLDLIEHQKDIDDENISLKQENFELQQKIDTLNEEGISKIKDDSNVIEEKKEDSIKDVSEIISGSSSENIEENDQIEGKKEVRNESTNSQTINVIEEFKHHKENNTSNEISLNDLKDNNTLIISEIDEKVYLPYDSVDICMNNDDHSESIDDIIKKSFVVPLSRYKFEKVARFRETFQMYRNERMSFINSIQTAYKISKNTKLHPAIITACKDHFELDMYLKCLNNNELDKFQLFDIQFKVRPSKKSNVCAI